MKRISKAALVTAVILLAAFWTTNPTDAGKKQPADPLSRPLQEAGLKQLEDEVVRRLGEAIEVGAPLRLDQRTAYPPATLSIDDFQPKALELSPEAVKRPLEPGDYSIPVIGFCTKWSLHYPGRGLPYKLARLQGRHAEAVSTLLWRGMLQGLPPKGDEDDVLANPRGCAAQTVATSGTGPGPTAHSRVREQFGGRLRPGNPRSL
jgi:hypothetical protein